MVLRQLHRLRLPRGRVAIRGRCRSQVGCPPSLGGSGLRGRAAPQQPRHRAGDRVVKPPATLYMGKVMHRRMFPVRYRFSYRVFSLLLDIDRLDDVARQSPLFSYNRFNLIGFYDRDHGPRDGTNLRVWIEGVLYEAGLPPAGRIELLCLPRVLGYVFNPLSLWFCYTAAGEPIAVLCEVHNTFGEAHSYLLSRGGKALSWPLKQSHQKHFHVSPFISMDALYRFCIYEPGERVAVVIRELQRHKPMLTATQFAQAKPFTTRSLLRATFSMPLMTLKVLVMIHWQALRIGVKGARVHRKPKHPPARQVSS